MLQPSDGESHKKALPQRSSAKEGVVAQPRMNGGFGESVDTIITSRRAPSVDPPGFLVSGSIW